MVALLCVLREDLFLELYGIINERIERLDDNNAAFRRVYFWRNSLRTLVEIKKVLARLDANASFTEAMTKEAEEVQTAYKKVRQELDVAYKDFVKDLRDAIGGHLLDKPFQTMLDRLDPFEDSLMEAGEIVGKTHYRFAPDLLWETVLQDIPAKERMAKIGELLGRTSKLSQVVKVIDDVFVCYMKSRGLP
jgi:hypothetical protein